MNKFFKIFLAILSFGALTYCSTDKKMLSPTLIKIGNASNFKIELTPGTAFNHPTFVIWMEDMDENYIKTIFITKSYASGIFGHKMVGDSIWLNESGESIQPAALPYWTHKKGLINGKSLVPDPKNPFIDAYSGATPQGRFVFSDSISHQTKYRILLEVNQTCDWNDYWTNNKYPASNAYKHSAQPSLIYAATINANDTVYYMNPIGHGSPAGEDGKLYTNLSTLTSGLSIFSSIKITINKR